MREYLTRQQLLEALENGERLEAHPRTPYAGQAVEPLPRKDATGNHPDAYPWHVVGRPDYDRLSHTQIVALEATGDSATKPECIICDEPSDELDTEGICPDCHDDAAAETADELRAAGIDPTDPPVVIAAEIMRRTTG